MSATQGQTVGVMGQPQPYTSGGKGGAQATPTTAVLPGIPQPSYTPPQARTTFNGGYGGNVFDNASNALRMAQQSAQRIASGGMGNYGGSYVGNVKAPDPYQSRMLSDTILAPYMNPYTRDVIDRTTADLNEARQMAVNLTGADATNAGAFGGSRHALREAQNDADFYDAVGRVSSQLNADNFRNAQQMALSDIGNENIASQFNRGQDLQAQMSNQNASAANASAAAQMRIAEANRQLQATQLLGNLSNLGFGMGQQIQAGNSQQGAQERALTQAIINGARQQFSGFTGAPNSNIDLLNSVMTGGVAPGGAGSRTSYEPGMMDYLSTIAMIYGAI